MADDTPEKLFEATEEHHGVARAFEVTVVRMMMGCDQPDHVHPSMIGALHAVGSMALQMINTDDDTDSLVYLVNALENDCRDVIQVLRDALAARGVPNGGKPN